MPDGTSTPAPRTIVVYEAAHARCPRCAQRLRVTVGEGAALVTCEARPPIACGQKVAVIGLVGRLSIVIPVSPAEFAELLGSDVLAEAILERLGLLAVPLMAAS